jgi:AcrR family transcriptional regulator
MSIVAAQGASADVRPLRADARRNRERVLEAARDVFADHGHEAQMDEIARRAKVGVGTVYRHFPTKEVLTAALVADSFRRIGDQLDEALAEDGNPWEAFTAVLWFGAELMAGNRGLTEAIGVMPTAPGDIPGVERVHERMAELIRRAQETGALRPDLCVDDIPMMMCGVGAATRKPHSCPESWRRHLSILLDGMRAQAATAKLPD